MPKLSVKAPKYTGVIHELKSWPKYFADVWSGKKLFELRKNDRNFKVGDCLWLRKFEPCDHCNGYGSLRDGSMPDASSNDDIDCPKCMAKGGNYLGPSLAARVEYMITDFTGLESGYCIMGIKVLALKSAHGTPTKLRNVLHKHVQLNQQ